MSNEEKCPECGEVLQTLEVKPFFTWTAKTGMQHVTGMIAQVCMNADCPKKWTVAKHHGETITDCNDDNQ